MNGRRVGAAFVGTTRYMLPTRKRGTPASAVHGSGQTASSGHMGVPETPDLQSARPTCVCGLKPALSATRQRVPGSR